MFCWAEGFAFQVGVLVVVVAPAATTPKSALKRSIQLSPTCVSSSTILSSVHFYGMTVPTLLFSDHCATKQRAPVAYRLRVE